MRMIETAGSEETRAWIPKRYLLGLLVLAWGFQVALIWSQHYPPLVDLPNHIAQHALEYRWWRGGATTVLSTGLPART